MKYIYYEFFTFLITGIMILFYRIFDRKKTNKIRFIDIIMMMILVVFAGLRDNVGSDYSAYEKIYLYYSKSALLGNLQIERIFYKAPYYLKNIYDDPVILFWFAAFLIYPLLIVYMRKKSVQPSLLFSYYMMSGLWMSSMNILRQTIAMTFMLWAYDMFQNRKYVRFILFFILALGFHISSIFMVMFIILTKIIKVNKNMLQMILVFSVSFAFFGKQLIIFICSSVPYLNRYLHYLVENSGTSMDRLRTIGAIGYLIFSIIMLMIIIINEKDIVSNVKNTDVLVFSVFSVVITAIGVGFPYVSRINLFFILLFMEIVPVLWNGSHTYNDRKNVRLLYCMLLIIWFIFITIYGLDNLSWAYKFH